MCDKGKKDKDNNRKQKIKKREQEARKNLEKIPTKISLHRIFNKLDLDRCSSNRSAGETQCRAWRLSRQETDGQRWSIFRKFG